MLLAIKEAQTKISCLWHPGSMRGNHYALFNDTIQIIPPIVKDAKDSGVYYFIMNAGFKTGPLGFMVIHRCQNLSHLKNCSADVGSRCTPSTRQSEALSVSTRCLSMALMSIARKERCASGI